MINDPQIEELPPSTRASKSLNPKDKTTIREFLTHELGDATRSISKYSERIVAFIDILGITERINNSPTSTEDLMRGIG